MFKRFWDELFNFIFPPICTLCRKNPYNNSKKITLCPECQNSIQHNRPPFCQRCSRPLFVSPEKNLCRNCQISLPHFDYALSSVLYTGSMQKLFFLFKYGNKTLLRQYFSHLMISFIESYSFNIKEFDWVIPVPLHPTRLRERGYNQSQLLSYLIASHYQLNHSTDNLIRVKNTHFQAKLLQKDRWTNIQGAFKINYSHQLKNKSILIVDDLITTGATTSEIAKILKQAGAIKVGVLTLAITP